MGHPLKIDLGPAQKQVVQTSDMNAKSTVADARKKAQEFVRQLKNTPLSKDHKAPQFSRLWNLAAEIWGVTIINLSPEVRNTFIYEVGSAFGGVSAFSVRDWNVVEKAESLVLTLSLSVPPQDDQEFEVETASSLSSIHWEGKTPSPNFPNTLPGCLRMG